MLNTLPHFRYHPGAVATGSIRVSDNRCKCCEQVRGYIYSGPVYAIGEYQDSLCPWCISDGTAHAKFGACFADESGIGGYGAWDHVPTDVIGEVAYRTPGFAGWQQEQWWTHCNDAAIFLGRQGYEELDAMGDDAARAIRENAGLEGPDWERFYRALHKDGSPTAYLFRCRHCGTLGGYQDCD